MNAGETIHASAVAVGGRGVLVRGASGSGKSSLVLALLTVAGVPAALVADDRVCLSAEGGRLLAAAPAAIAGKMEVRGFGIVERAYRSPAAIDLVADLLPLAECPRLPAANEARTLVIGVSLPRIFIAVGAPDGAARVLAALAQLSP